MNGYVGCCSDLRSLPHLTLPFVVTPPIFPLHVALRWAHSTLPFPHTRLVVRSGSATLPVPATPLSFTPPTARTGYLHTAPPHTGFCHGPDPTLTAPGYCVGCTTTRTHRYRSVLPLTHGSVVTTTAPPHYAHAHAPFSPRTHVPHTTHACHCVLRCARVHATTDFHARSCLTTFPHGSLPARLRTPFWLVVLDFLPATVYRLRLFFRFRILRCGLLQFGYFPVHCRVHHFTACARSRGSGPHRTRTRRIPRLITPTCVCTVVPAVWIYRTHHAFCGCHCASRTHTARFALLPAAAHARTPTFACALCHMAVCAPAPRCYVYHAATRVVCVLRTFRIRCT